MIRWRFTVKCAHTEHSTDIRSVISLVAVICPDNNATIARTIRQSTPFALFLSRRTIEVVLLGSLDHPFHLCVPCDQLFFPSFNVDDDYV